MAVKADTLKIDRPLFRSFELNRSTFDKEKRTVSVQFSSETPVARWFGDEILDHSAESVDLSRINAGAAVLMEHDCNQRIGITEGGQVTSSKTGLATVRFARTPAGDSAMAEVEDGTLRWLSVGYRVNRFLVDEETETYRAVSWQPMEVSFVAIPADPTARVFRANKIEEYEVPITMKRSHPLHEAAASTVGAGGGSVAPQAPNIVTAEDFSRQLEEAREIVGLAAHWQRTHPQVAEAAEKAIKDKTPLVKFQRQVMEMIQTPARADLTAPAIGEGQAPAFRGAVSSGRRFVDSDAYKAAIKSGNKNSLRSISVELAYEYSFRCVDQALLQRTTFSATTEAINGTSGASIQIVPGIPGLLNQQPLYVADLFAQGATNSSTIRYLQEDTYTNAATRVAEGSGKPEGALDVSVVNATVEKTAVYLKVTDEMISDFDQMQSFINGRLGYMVQALEDQQLLTGSGSSQIKGVLNFSGLQTVSGAAGPVDALLKAIEYVRGANGAGFAQPDAVVIHPLDWLNIRLSKDANGQYLFGGPAYAPYGVGGYSNVGMAWGIPVVVTTSITRGTALAGAFRMSAQIFRRRGLTIESTNSDGSDFVNNLITIRAEQRMGLAVYQPNRFCSITSIPA